MTAESKSEFKFTVKGLEAVSCPPSGRIQRDGRVWVRDAETPGLYFSVTENGARAFYVIKRMGKKLVKKRLGAADELTIAQARAVAAADKTQIILGNDPQAAKIAGRNEATFGDLWENYLAKHAEKYKRASSVREDLGLWKRHLSDLAPLPLSEVTREKLETLHTRIGKEHKTAANRILALVSTMFRKRGGDFGLKRSDNPTEGIGRFKENARSRVLSGDEYERFMAALEQEKDETIRDYLKMSLWTGARRSNVSAMRWNDISIPRIGAAVWTIPGEVTKNGEPLKVQLLPEAVALLEARQKAAGESGGGFVFPSRLVTVEQFERVQALRAAGKSTREIADAVGVSQTQIMRMMKPGFIAGEAKPLANPTKAYKRNLGRAEIKEQATLHDLRRTFASRLIDKGAPLSVVAKAMGHKSHATTAKHYAIASDALVRDYMTKAISPTAIQATPGKTPKGGRTRKAAG